MAVSRTCLCSWYITVLKIRIEIYKGERQVKMESFWSTISVWNLRHKPTIKTAIKGIHPVPFSRIFVGKIFCKLFSKYRWQSLFVVKSHAFSIFFWIPLDGCACNLKIVLRRASYFRRSNNIETTKTSLQKHLMKTH